jgi:methylamine dehydrogenase heavy chain
MQAFIRRSGRAGVVAGCLLLTCASLGFAPAAGAASTLEPELGGVAETTVPGSHWFMAVGFAGGGNLFDADSGEMRGKLNLSGFTSAVSLDRKRERFYVPGSYYSRGTYGERTDVLVINDAKTLAAVGEVPVPKKLAATGHRAVINPIGDKFVGLYNMTPAMSVSIVDVEKPAFIAELSTAGCAFVYPLSDRRFMQLCGDGTVQVIGLDRSGAESSRERSEPFFDIDEDPVFDLAAPTRDGWLLVSFEGKVFEVSVGSGITVSKPWSILTPEDVEDGWRIGGDQPLAYNAATGMLFTLMHQGEKDTHEEAGTEVWAFNTTTQRRGYRLALDEPAGAIEISRDDDPLLYVVTDKAYDVHVHQASTGRLLRTIEKVGASRVQAF